jgi:hypothetical protein
MVTRLRGVGPRRRPSLRSWLAPAAAVLTAVIVIAGFAPVAVAAPNTPSGHDSDGNPPLLRDVLESASRGYLQARAKLQKSRARQLKLSLELSQIQSRLDILDPQVGQIAAESYRTGRMGALAVLLNSSSPDAFVERALALDEMNMVNGQKLAALNEAKAQAARAKAAIDAEVREQQKQTVIMAKQKRETEKALALVGGKGLTVGGLVAATSPVARMGPGRTVDGDWKPESCSENDPTTSGCVTPRTLHAYNEVRRAGFNRFAGCYRPGGPYEHPKGRACDWSLQNSGFSPARTTDQRLYGNNLTAFLVRNADRLGIYYVIWYRQIWFPATGWKSYSGASDHTDHVHMSLL